MTALVSDAPRHGFSLVEMLVVLAILALAAVIGMPSIRHLMPSQRLDGTAGRIANEIALLRSDAQRTGQTTWLVYDGDAQRFLSSRPGASSLPMSGWSVQFEPASPRLVRAGELRFFPDGGSTGARMIVSGPGGSRLLSVSRATGVVRQMIVSP